MRMMTLYLLAAALVQGQAGRPDPEPKLAVTLQDGSQFVAPVGSDALSIRTEYGEQRIPLKDLRSMRRLSDTEFMVQTATFSTTGEIARREFEFQSEIGRLKIPLGEIRSLSASLGLSVLADAHTIAAWSFSDVARGVSFDLVKNRRLELHDLESSTDKEGVGALGRKGENSYGEAAGADLEIPPGDFTIEARFVAGVSPRGYSAVVSKMDGVSGQPCDFNLYAQSNGVLYFQSTTNRGSMSINTPTPVIKPNEWSYVAVVVQPALPQVTFYANGKKVHQVKQAAHPSGVASSLFIGSGPPYHTSLACAEKIQFVRLSKTARGAEEIAELQTTLGSGGGLAAWSASKGVVLRGGGFVRASFPTLAGTRFRTKYGVLTLGEGTPGQITVYRYREDELEQVRDEVKILIHQLGAGAVQEREEAYAKLLKIGEPAVPLLRDCLKDSDAEVRHRAEGVLKKFEGTGALSRPIGDVYRLGQTVLHGWLDASSVDVATKFGTFKPTVRKIDRINLGDRPLKGRPLLRLRSGEAVQGDPAKETAIRLDTGFGALSIPLADVTALTYDAAKDLWLVKTERVTASGKIGGEDLRLETAAGAIVLPASEIVEILLP